MKDEKPRCDYCGKYVGYQSDQGTYYGCADPEAPEPLDPTYFCHTCASKEYREMIPNLKEGGISCCWWIKPEWYLKAIKDSGFELINDSHNYSLRKLNSSKEEK